MAGLITTLLFAGVGLYIIFFLLGSVLSGIWGSGSTLNFSGSLFKWRFKRYQRALEDADKNIGQNKLSAASEDLRNAFCLEVTPGFLKEFDVIHEHNFSVLGKVMSLYEDTESHLGNLPIVDELLQSRYDLMRTLYDTRLTKQKLKLREAEKQKNSPQWAYEEMDAKIKECIERLKTNRLSLISQVDQLFASLRNVSGQSTIQYH